jgi:hypothetical protein
MSNKRDKKENSLPSRRKFLTGAGLTAAAVACAGKDGLNGLNGADGTNGTGTPGQNGVNGVDGVNGVNGVNGTNCTNAPNGLNAIPTSWDYTADVVVIGAGAAGLVAALAAKDKGADVLVVEANYDVGGHCITSGGMVDLGGGTGPQVSQGITTDSADLVFHDLVFPASYAAGTGLVWGSNAGPFQDRAFCRVYADHNIEAEKFLRDQGIVWQPTITTSHWAAPSGTPRTHTPTWKNNANVVGVDNPGGKNGTGYVRPLEKTARLKGIKFLLNYRVNAIHREAAFSGGVKGVTAEYTPLTINGTKLQPYCSTAMAVTDSFPNTGNIAETHATLNIKANNAVFVATGGATSNVMLRRVFDSRFCDVHQVAGEPYSYQTGDGILLSQKCGASLYATGNEADGGSSDTKPGSIGCRFGYQNLQWVPASPVFALAGGSGLKMPSGNTAYANLIHVNMAGDRFVDETASGYVWLDAALQPNRASIGPDWGAGPVWAIFDEAARALLKWDVTTAGSVDPKFFYSANTIADLVAKINTHQYQASPMKAADLQATITRYNSFVGAKVDSDFAKPAASLTATIAQAPFYAAFSSPVLHDWLTGVRIDEGAHVLDLDAKVIPGLFAAGEDVGGMVMHGLAKCAVYGMIGGRNAALGV